MYKVQPFDDITPILEMCKTFHSFSPYASVPYDEKAVRQMVTNVLDKGVIFANDGGFIAGILTPLFFSPTNFVATELAWWCPDEDGQELKTAFEEWAKEQGAGASQISTLNNQYMGTLGEMLIADGYRPIEIAYIKGLT